MLSRVFLSFYNKTKKPNHSFLYPKKKIFKFLNNWARTERHQLSVMTFGSYLSASLLSHQQPSNSRTTLTRWGAGRHPDPKTPSYCSLWDLVNRERDPKCKHTVLCPLDLPPPPSTLWPSVPQSSLLPWPWVNTQANPDPRRAQTLTHTAATAVKSLTSSSILDPRPWQTRQ